MGHRYYKKACPVGAAAILRAQRTTGHLALSVPIDPTRTLCFTGHRQIVPKCLPTLTTSLDAQLETQYAAGYRTFIAGGALGFDTLAAERVLHLKQRHPDARLLLAIPCVGQDAHWTESQQIHYARLCYAADGCIRLSDHYYSGCMMVRNRFMVDHASLCICYMEAFRGGTVATVAYALKKGIPVLNLAMTLPHPTPER